MNLLEPQPRYIFWIFKAQFCFINGPRVKDPWCSMLRYSQVQETPSVAIFPGQFPGQDMDILKHVPEFQMAGKMWEPCLLIDTSLAPVLTTASGGTGYPHRSWNEIISALVCCIRDYFN